MTNVTLTLDKAEAYTLLIALGMFEDILLEECSDNSVMNALQPSMLEIVKKLSGEAAAQLNSEAN